MSGSVTQILNDNRVCFHSLEFIWEGATPSFDAWSEFVFSHVSSVNEKLIN